MDCGNDFQPFFFAPLDDPLRSDLTRSAPPLGVMTLSEGRLFISLALRV